MRSYGCQSYEGTFVLLRARTGCRAKSLRAHLAANVTSSYDGTGVEPKRERPCMLSAMAGAGQAGAGGGAACSGTGEEPDWKKAGSGSATACEGAGAGKSNEAACA